MNRILARALSVWFCGWALLATTAGAKVDAAKAETLNGDALTCLGADKSGTPGGVAAYSGKYLGTWPGQTRPYGYEPGPYAAEKPLFSVTAKNLDQYAAQLTAGQKALLRQYPDAFRMNVYPSHRDFRVADWVCEATKANATHAEVIHDGKGVEGISGAVPFPFPQNGLEAVWNVINPHRTWSESAITDTADVYSDGAVSWIKQKFMTLDPGKNPAQRGSYQDHVGAYFFAKYLLPARDKGLIAVGFQPNDFSRAQTQTSWMYQPGTRRVRQAAAIGFDYPVPPGGLRTVDEDYAFNGSPERYDWTLIGKKEIFVPYHNFRVNDPALRYADLVRPYTLNPDYVRYERHRVWVIEGRLRQGVRHLYKKRVLYADEDGWLVLWADNYDGRDQLWRTSYINYFYSQESQTFHRGVSVYHDLNARAYEAAYLVNEAGEGWWRLNQPLTPQMFSPEAAAQGGH
jgi:hypothetical protein